MRKFFVFIIFIFFVLSQQAYAEKLITGGVTYNVDEAREYVFDDVQPFKINTKYAFERSDNVERIVYSYDNNHKIIAATVLYKTEMSKAYIYDANKKLIYVDIYDKNVNIFPHRGYRYNLNGKLILTSLSVSKDEHFRFDSYGNLLAHSINGIIYDENGNVIGTAK